MKQYNLLAVYKMKKSTIKNLQTTKQKLNYLQRSESKTVLQLFRLNRKGKTFYFVTAGKRRGGRLARKILNSIISRFPELTRENYSDKCSDYSQAYDKTLQRIYRELETGIIETDNGVFTFRYKNGALNNAQFTDLNIVK